MYIIIINLLDVGFVILFDEIVYYLFTKLFIVVSNSLFSIGFLIKL
jgi:hypothetical protein